MKVALGMTVWELYWFGWTLVALGLIVLGWSLVDWSRRP